MYSKNERKRYWARLSRELPFYTKAYRKWGKEAVSIDGEGPFASLAFCRVGGWNGPTLSIELYKTLAEAVQAQHGLCCGGQYCIGSNEDCEHGGHQIWDMSSRGYRRLDKNEFYTDAPENTVLKPEFQR